MFCVSASISVEPIAQVHRFLGHDNFNRFQFRKIDAGQVDKNQMGLQTRLIHVRPAELSADSPSEPSLKKRAIVCRQQWLMLKSEMEEVALQKFAGSLISN